MDSDNTFPPRQGRAYRDLFLLLVAVNIPGYWIVRQQDPTLQLICFAILFTLLYAVLTLPSWSLPRGWPVAWPHLRLELEIAGQTEPESPSTSEEPPPYQAVPTPTTSATSGTTRSTTRFATGTISRKVPAIKGTVALTIVPSPDLVGAKLRRAPWFAEVRLTTPDLPRLMRKGIHWSEKNVLLAHSEVKDNLRDVPVGHWLQYGSTCQRVLRLASPNNGSASGSRSSTSTAAAYWDAEMTVFFRNLATLSSFKVEAVSPYNVHHAEGFSNYVVREGGFDVVKQRLVYRYDARSPGTSFNAIYGGRGFGPVSDEKKSEVPGIEKK